MTAPVKKIRVLVCEDSSVARQLLVATLRQASELDVVGQAHDGEQAVQLAQELKPDVITMDVHMPKMDGLEATRKIMEIMPTPIVVVSANDPKDIKSSFAAMNAGAVSVLGKPQGPTSPEYPQQASELRRTVIATSQARVTRRRVPTTRTTAGVQPPRAATSPPRMMTSPTSAAPPAAPSRPRTRPVRTPDVVAVGSSTGGPQALAKVFGAMTDPLPVPALVVQHISAGFHEGLASWLDSVCPMTVKLAEHGERLQPGVVYVASGEGHLGVRAGKVAIADAPAVDGHRPSVTHLFESVAREFRDRAVGVILTGMGADGANGMVRMHDAGALTFGQDQQTSVVYGMPKEAAARGAVDRELPLEDIAAAVVKACRRT